MLNLDIDCRCILTSCRICQNNFSFRRLGRLNGGVIIEDQGLEVLALTNEDPTSGNCKRRQSLNLNEEFQNVSLHPFANLQAALIVEKSLGTWGFAMYRTSQGQERPVGERAGIFSVIWHNAIHNPCCWLRVLILRLNLNVPQ